MPTSDTINQQYKTLCDLLKRHFQAEGNGLHELTDSCCKNLSPLVILGLRRVATIRNKLFHETEFTVDKIPADWDALCQEICERLSGHEPNQVAPGGVIEGASIRERTNGPPTAAISAPEPPGCKSLEIKGSAGRFMGRGDTALSGHEPNQVALGCVIESASIRESCDSAPDAPNQRTSEYYAQGLRSSQIGDHKEAASYFGIAAAQNLAMAQWWLGHCYLNHYHSMGVPITVATAEAIKWIRKAAEQNIPGAQCALGHSYYLGQGVEGDYLEAVTWYRKAIDQNDADAQNSLGGCYQAGKGLEKDYSEAVKWYRKAVEQNFAQAQYNLADCYLNGYALKQDLTEAVKWYYKAAEQNLAKAQYKLANFYASGHGVKRDLTEAVKWYRKAAEQNCDAAQNSLGDCYFDGKGVKENRVEACAWYGLAARSHELAAKRLSERTSQYPLNELIVIATRTTELQAQIEAKLKTSARDMFTPSDPRLHCFVTVQTINGRHTSLHTRPI